MKSPIPVLLLTLFMCLASSQGMTADPIPARNLRVVALGDSLTSGYGLDISEAFPAKLEAALRKNGLNVTVENAGVSGDTTAGGLARLNQSIAGPVKPDLVIVELGANDILRRLSAVEMENNLRQILSHLQQQKIPVLLAGMKAPFYMPGPFRGQYIKVYSKLADEFDVPLYEFFLDGVAFDPKYNLDDRLHPNAQGIDIIVEKIQSKVQKLLKPKKGFFGFFK